MATSYGPQSCLLMHTASYNAIGTDRSYLRPVLEANGLKKKIGEVFGASTLRAQLSFKLATSGWPQLAHRTLLEVSTYTYSIERFNFSIPQWNLFLLANSLFPKCSSSCVGHLWLAVVAEQAGH